ncbi:MAG: T9SS type A sorting domain-containing protein [Chitinophagales bacterium]|nr:T9SS type A sorting domain-containing protein [Chitinophagales bacterium]
MDFNNYYPSTQRPDGTTQTAVNSGEDWFYDLKYATENGKPYGYICAGYSTYPQLTGTTGCGNIGLGGYDPDDLDIPGTWNHRAPHCKLAFVNMQGQMEWYYNYPVVNGKVADNGRFYAVLQNPDESYIACGVTRFVQGVAYNPTPQNPGGLSLNCVYDNENNIVATRKAFVVKTDVEGNLLWQYYYGIDDLIPGASSSNGVFYAVTPNVSNGSFLLTGTYNKMMFVVEINANGQVMSKSLRTGLNGYSSPIDYIRPRAIIHDPATNNIFVVGYIKAQDQTTVHPDTLGRYKRTIGKGSSFVVKLDANYNQVGNGIYKSTSLSAQYWFEDGNTSTYAFINNFAQSMCWFNTTTNPKTFLVSFLADAAIDAVNSENGYGYGTGVVECYNTNLSMLNAASIGTVRAFDLQVGVAKTSDGGFAVVSTKHVTQLTDCTHPFSPYMINTCTYQGTVYNGRYSKQHWNSDAYISKYSSAFVKLWEKTISENTPPTNWGGYNPPTNYGNIGDPRLQGDLKREECVYKIIETPFDAGLVVCGNNSNNLDDDLLIKLHSNCQKLLTFSGADINTDLNIITNTTRNTSRKVSGDIRIKPGATLTINGSTTVIQFTDTRQVGKQVHLIVEQGGKLVLAGGAKLTGITTCPNSTWEGIQVWGNGNLSQLPESNQGVVEVNNGTIENARIGIVAGLMNYTYNVQSQIDYSLPMTPIYGFLGGGIVKCSNATFTNCGTDVRMHPYAYFSSPGVEVANRSFFTTSNFITNNSFLVNNHLAQHIFLNGVGGIKINGCKFENNRTNITETEEMGYGIYSVDAGYQVLPQCTAYSGSTCVGEVRSKFKNLEYGVRATRISSTRTFTVDKSDFDGSIIAIKNEGISNMTVQNCTLIIGNSPVALSTNTGVFIEGNCTNYTVRNNAFNRAAITNGVSVNYGVNVSNTGTSDTRVEKNNYNQLSVSNSSAYINRSSNGITGLQFLCNTYAQTTLLDQVAFLNNSSSTDGIRYSQGTVTIAAGNKFTFPPPTFGTAGHLWSMPSPTVTYFYGNGTNEFPTNVSTNVQRTPTNQPSQCSTGGGGGGMMAQGGGLTQQERSALEIEFASNNQSYNNYVQQLQLLKDGGNSQLLQNEIALTLSSEAAALRTKLLGESPYLSEAALKELSDKSGVLPDALIFEILAANPDELKNDALFEYLEQKNNPLPQWMLDILKQAKGTITARTLLEAGIMYYKEKAESAAFEIIKGILADENGVNNNDLRGWLGNLNSKEADYEIVSNYYETGNYNAALSFLNSIPQLRDLSNDELAEHDLLNSVYQIISSASANSRSIDSLNTEQVALLTEIADAKPCKAMVMANAILRTYYGRKFDTYPFIHEEFQTSQLRSAKYEGKAYTNPADRQEVKVYPNPAKDMLIFDYHVFKLSGMVTITIYDVTGKKMMEENLTNQLGQSIIDTQHLPNGMYNYTITSSNFSKSGNFTVFH